MPKTWLYFFALVLPVIFRVLVLDLPAPEWFWYHQYPQIYDKLSRLRVNQQFLTYIGSPTLIVFVGTTIIYWLMDFDDESLGKQFLLLPLAYVPFAIVGNMILTLHVNVEIFYIYPLVILPFGYVYIMAWAIVIWVLGKLRLAT